ncbi:MAG: flagellar hook-length control protein FliK [Nitrospirae bacterium]|nr:flagellar hook-length control protein FliK [Nitrospirota bacterium]
MNIPPVFNSENLIAILKTTSRPMSFMIGDIVKAEVLTSSNSGEASLRILQGRGGTLEAKTDLNLNRGDILFLRVTGLEREIRFQLVDRSSSPISEEEGPDKGVSRMLNRMLLELGGSRLNSEDIGMLKAIFRSIPGSVTDSHPELLVLEKALPDAGGLNAEKLKTAVEGSGILFEARLAAAARESAGEAGDKLLKMFFGTQPDLKAQLLRLRETLRGEDVGPALISAGHRQEEILNAVDRLIRHIEYFQATSRLNDLLYSFLPLKWDGLKDGDISFKRGADDSSYVCTMTLDLEALGRLSVTVTMFEDSFYLTLNIEQEDSLALIQGERPALEKQFEDSGLLLRAVNVGQRKRIDLGVPVRQGLKLRV